MALPPRIHFAAGRDRDGEIAQVAYLMATARAAGHTAAFLPVDDISWHAGLCRLVAPDGTPLEACFKLCPWGWLDAEEGGPRLTAAGTRMAARGGARPPWTRDRLRLGLAFRLGGHGAAGPRVAGDAVVAVTGLLTIALEARVFRVRLVGSDVWGRRWQNARFPAHGSGF